MSILVFNAGSTSLKFGLFDRAARQCLAGGAIDWAGGDRRRAQLTIDAEPAPPLRAIVDVPDDQQAACAAIRGLEEALQSTPAAGATIDYVGHRVVHGGTAFANSVVIDAAVFRSIESLAELAPLHNPPALRAIAAARAALPAAVQVAVFDTAFYAALPPRAFVYPLPYDWYTQWGIRRYGFHGISQKYCAGRVAELLGRDGSDLRIVSCHLGGGCSAAAIRGGVPVATTMGFTPLEGLPMGTRSGTIDPGILLHVQRRHGLSVEQLDDMLNCRSGLLGLSGVSSDLAHIEAAAREGNARAQLACEVFADRVRATIGALAVMLGGVEALVFTDRIGENSPALRAAACQGLECLGLHLDASRNVACRPDGDVATAASPGRILVLHTREELMIAREVRRLIGAAESVTENEV